MMCHTVIDSNFFFFLGSEKNKLILKLMTFRVNEIFDHLYAKVTYQGEFCELHNHGDTLFNVGLKKSILLIHN